MACHLSNICIQVIWSICHAGGYCNAKVFQPDIFTNMCRVSSCSRQLRQYNINAIKELKVGTQLCSYKMVRVQKQKYTFSTLPKYIINKDLFRDKVYN